MYELRAQGVPAVLSRAPQPAPHHPHPARHAHFAAPPRAGPAPSPWGTFGGSLGGLGGAGGNGGAGWDDEPLFGGPATAGPAWATPAGRGTGAWNGAGALPGAWGGGGGAVWHGLPKRPSAAVGGGAWARPDPLHGAPPELRHLPWGAQQYVKAVRERREREERELAAGAAGASLSALPLRLSSLCSASTDSTKTCRTLLRPALARSPSSSPRRRRRPGPPPPGLPSSLTPRSRPRPRRTLAPDSTPPRDAAGHGRPGRRWPARRSRQRARARRRRGPSGTGRAGASCTCGCTGGGVKGLGRAHGVAHGRQRRCSGRSFAPSCSDSRAARRRSRSRRAGLARWAGMVDDERVCIDS